MTPHDILGRLSSACGIGAGEVGEVLGFVDMLFVGYASFVMRRWYSTAMKLHICIAHIVPQVLDIHIPI